MAEQIDIVVTGKPHLLKPLYHIAHLCLRCSRQAYEHFVHHHLDHRLIQILPRRHHRHIPDYIPSPVRVVDHGSRDVIVPFFPFDEIAEHLFRQDVLCDDKHLLCTCTLPVVFPDHLFKCHVHHIGDQRVQDRKYAVHRTRKLIGLLQEI